FRLSQSLADREHARPIQIVGIQRLKDGRASRSRIIEKRPTIPAMNTAVAMAGGIYSAIIV
ncbi:MAG: hypothetical protein WBD46_04020, partial [Acidobacteriaceae bacterium]